MDPLLLQIDRKRTNNQGPVPCRDLQPPPKELQLDSDLTVTNEEFVDSRGRSFIPPILLRFGLNFNIDQLYILCEQSPSLYLTCEQGEVPIEHILHILTAQGQPKSDP